MIVGYDLPDEYVPFSKDEMELLFLLLFFRSCVFLAAVFLNIVARALSKY